MTIHQIIEASKRLSTEEAAARLKVKPQTLRAAVCRNSHYCGIRPTKGPNRFLYWPADEIDRLLSNGEATCSN